MKKIKVKCPCCGEIFWLDEDLSASEHQLGVRQRNNMPGDVAIDGKTDMSLCDKASLIEFRNSSFCFTGKCTYSSRTKLKQLVRILGGVVVDYVTIDLDYLIVGAAASEGWRNGNYGGKIDDAMRLRELYPACKVLIISEENLYHCLEREVGNRNALTGGGSR